MVNLQVSLFQYSKYLIFEGYIKQMFPFTMLVMCLVMILSHTDLAVYLEVVHIHCWYLQVGIFTD